MNKQLTVKQYVIIDLVIFAILLCALEIASKVALNFFRREAFAISVILPIILIAMMRHGIKALPLAALGGLVYSALNGAEPEVYIVYILGNCFVGVNVLWFKYVEKEKIREKIWLIILYVITGYILKNLGKGVVAYIMGFTHFAANTVRYLTTDALSAVMTVIVILIARRQDGVFEDQMAYLIRQAEMEEDKNGKEK